MAEGTNVGSIFLDLIVRDTVQKQTERIAAKAQATAQRAFTGMENAITGSFNKAIVSAQAKVNDLARQMERVTEKFNDAKLSDNDTAAQKWAEHRERVYERLEAAREKLTIEITAAAQKEAAAEERAAQKAVAVDQREVHRRKAIHESMWKNMLSTAGNASKAISNKASGITKGFGKASKAASYFGSRLKGIVTSALIFNGISAGLRKLTDYLGKTISSTDEMKQALANLKGAAATAAAPLIQAITPAIVALTNAAATVFHYLSKLISLFTGKSVQSMANAAKKINKSTKDATRSLADFDEIQKLGDNSSKSVEPNYNYQAESTFLEAAVKKIQQLVAPLQKINFSPLIASLGKLGESFLGFGATIAKSLEWAWYEILVPLAEWTIEKAAPAAVDALSAAFEALDAVLRPLLDGFKILWEKLQPVVSYIGDSVIIAFQELEKAFEKVAQLFTEKSPEIERIFSGIGDAAAALWAVLEPIFVRWRDASNAINQIKFDIASSKSVF